MEEAEEVLSLTTPTQGEKEEMEEAWFICGWTN